MEQTPRIRPLGEENAHFWLVQRMAKATGVDLVAAWERDLLDSQDWAAIVGRCRGCQWAEGCGHWLDHSGDVPRDVPDTCLNNTRLERIRARLEESIV